MDKKSEHYRDGYKAGANGEKDMSEMHAREWGRKAGSEYNAGYLAGDEAYVQDQRAGVLA